MRAAAYPDMRMTHEPDITETEVLERPIQPDRPERVTNAPAYVTPRQVNANSYAPVWTVTRVVTLFFTVLEVLLLVRFGLKLLGANAGQGLVAGLYATTEPLTRPFQGIWPQTNTPVVFDLPALLAIVFLFLVAALIVAVVRAIAPNRAA